jgi:hypothetical protein
VPQWQQTIEYIARLEGSQTASTVAYSSHKEPELVLITVYKIDGYRAAEESRRRTIDAYLHKLPR